VIVTLDVDEPAAPALALAPRADTQQLAFTARSLDGRSRSLYTHQPIGVMTRQHDRLHFCDTLLDTSLLHISLAVIYRHVRKKMRHAIIRRQTLQSHCALVILL
jgi:hypothetical protein